MGVPSAMPVTIPEPVPTVAIALLLLLHEPPGVISINVIVLPIHTLPGPVIGAGTVFTVTVAVLTHAAGVVYVIVVLPGKMPVTIPEDEPTEATNGLLLLHMPPVVESLSAVVAPGQTLSMPPIAGAIQVIAGALFR